MSKSQVDNDILAEFGVEAEPEAEAKPAPIKTLKKDYHAFVLSRGKEKTQEGLAICYGSDIDAELPYPQKVESLRIGNKFLYLFFNHCTIEIEGDNFTREVVTNLRRRLVMEIHVFEEREFNPPSPGEPIIKYIRRLAPYLSLRIDADSGGTEVIKPTEAKKTPVH